MSIFEGIILGFIQGITEFLPISSSGHLIIIRNIPFLNFVATGDDLAIDAILQLGTILSVFIYFHKDIKNLLKTFLNWIQRKQISIEKKNLLVSIIIGTIPALILGIILEDYMESTFRNIKLVAATLLMGSLLMFIAEKKGKQNQELTIRKGFIVGIFQTLALIPGISRSGSTISGGLIVGLNREKATRYSFLLSLPIISGSGLKKLFDISIENNPDILNTALFFGFLTSFVIGLGCIHFLIKYLKNHKLNVFIIYRVLLAVLILFLF